MARALTKKQRERVHREAGDGRDVMMWDADEHFAARKEHAAAAIQRLQALGYAVTGVRTSAKAWGQPLITEFDVALSEDQRARTSERIKRGMATARAEGTQIGRPRARDQNSAPARHHAQDVDVEAPLAAARRRLLLEAGVRRGYYMAAASRDDPSRPVIRSKLSPEQQARKIARIRASQARTKALGTHIGRPRIDPKRVEQIKALLARGWSLRAVAAAVGVGRGTVARISVRKL